MNCEQQKVCMFPDAPDLKRDWRVVWANGDETLAIPDDDGCFELMAIAPKGVETAELSIDFEMNGAGFLIMGLGVDWYCEAVINGNVVYSSWNDGNFLYPPAADNHILPVFVNKGMNTLQLRSRSGSASWRQFVRFYSPNAGGLKKVSRQKLLECLFPSNINLDYNPIVVPNGKDGVSLLFVTSTACGGGVRLWHGDKWTNHYETLGGRIRNDSRIHHVEIKGLAAGESYGFQPFSVDCDNGMEKLIGNERTLNMPAENAPVRFFVFGDLHRTIAERQALLSDYWRNCGICDSDVLVSLGDVVNGSFNFEYDTFSAFDELQSHDDVARLMVVLRGNHEMRGKEADAYFRYFAPDGCGCGAFRVGDVACIWLDACECDAYKPQPNSHTYLNVAEKEYLARQREWLEAQLAKRDFLEARHRIVFCHGMPVATGKNDYMPNNLLWLTDGLLTGKNPKASIDLWVAGHVHNYRHFKANERLDVPFDVMCVDGPDYGGRDESAFVIEAGEKLRVKVVGRGGERIDDVTIKKE